MAVNYKKQKPYYLLFPIVRHLPKEFKGYNLQLGKLRLKDGILTIAVGYEWDGASGAVDAGFMEGSCVHDALCDLMDAGLLPKKLWNKAAWVMNDVNKQAGMNWPRRQWTHAAVRLYGRTK